MGEKQEAEEKGEKEAVEGAGSGRREMGYGRKGEGSEERRDTGGRREETGGRRRGRWNGGDVVRGQQEEPSNL